MKQLISRPRITKSDRLRPIAIDLFAGCGGLSLGLEAGGFDVANAIQDLSDIPAFIGEDKGINSTKLDYTDFRQNFTLKPQGIYRLCHHRHHNGLVYNHICSNYTEKSIRRFQANLPGKTEKIKRKRLERFTV